VVWEISGLLAGESCAWVSPWFQRARASFDVFKQLLAPLAESGEVKVSEGVLRIRHIPSGGSIDFYSADNPQAIYGANHHRVVIDEASRCPSEIWPAALTTISASDGKIRCAFNLELGSKNWAIRNLLRVQAMSPEERQRASEDFLTFPTGGDGLVDAGLIEILRSQMPEPLWAALYAAQIPQSDVSLFRNLDKIFTGVELASPLEGHEYVAGVDLARKMDWSVVSIIDCESGAVVASDRFHQISWSLQCERVAALCRHFRCGKVYVDCTGVGDPVAEQLATLGVEVEPFVFTTPSRKALLEALVVACDNSAISLPATEKFQNYRHELESFEYVLDGQSVKYAAPSNMHDDCVMSLALAFHGWKAAAGAAYGLLDFVKTLGRAWDGFIGTFRGRESPRTDLVGKAASFEFEMQACGLKTSRPENWQEPLGPCAACGSKCVTRIGGLGIRCGQCGHVDATGLPEPARVTRGDVLSGRIPARSFTNLGVRRRLIKPQRQHRPISRRKHSRV